MPGKGDTSTHGQGALRSEHQVCPPVPPVSSVLGCTMGRWQGLGDAHPFTPTPPNPAPPPCSAERGTQCSVTPTAERRGKTWSLHKLHPADLSQRVRWPPRRPARQGVAQRQRAGVTLL